MSFKRNQLEGALRELLRGPASSSLQGEARPDSVDLRIRIKRLLEVDRAWAEKHAQQAEKHGLAFHDEPPSGRGYDVSYSAQCAFNLAIALHLVEFGFKPSAVVQLIATLRPQLGKAFRRAKIFNLTDNDPSGMGANTVDSSVFFIVRRDYSQVDERIPSAPNDETSNELIRSTFLVGWKDLQKSLQAGRESLASGIFLIELSGLAWRLERLLEQQPATLRGRLGRHTVQ